MEVNSQICAGMTQYDKCSSNSGCACLYIAGAIDIGICAEQSLVNCSELRPCQPTTNLCQEPNHKCVHHPRCHNQPVCYPIPNYNRQLCPLISGGTTTTSTVAPQIIIPNLPENAIWTKNAVTIAGGNSNGSATNQLKSPYAVLVDNDEKLLIVDSGNHRIIEWKKGNTNGQVVAGGNGEGNRLDQLSIPTNVVIDKETNSLIICDWGNTRILRWSRRSGTKQGEILLDDIMCSGLALDDQGYLYVSDIAVGEVRRYGIGDKTGTVVAGGNGDGVDLNQLSWPTHIFVDRQRNVYVSEFGNHRVTKWTYGATEGTVVAGGLGESNALMRLERPTGIVVDSLNTVYVADSKNDRIIRWRQGTKEGTVIAGGNGSGTAPNQLFLPFNLAFDRYGNLYVADRFNHRIQRFSLE